MALKNPWLRYLLRFSLTAVIGSVVVFYSAPVIGSIPPVRKRLEAFQRGELRVALPRPQPTPSNTSHTPARREQAPLQATTTQPPQPEPAGGLPSGNIWAVVTKNEARAYSRNGKFLGRLENATAFDVVKTENTASGKMVIGLDPAGSGNEFVIRAEDVELAPGSLADITSSERRLRIQKARLLGEIDRLTDPQALAAQNPHTEEFRAARAAYRAYGVQVKALTDKRDQSTGHERHQAMEELRKLQVQGVTLSQEYEAAKRKFESWQPAGQRQTDEQVDALRREVASLDQRLKDASR